jgi:signal peptidase II
LAASEGKRESPAESAQAGAPRAWRSSESWAVLLSTFILGLTADLVSKAWVFATLMARPDHFMDLIPGILRLSLSTNPGIVFGIRAPWPLVMVATAAAVIVVLYLFAGSSRKSWPLHAALGMVLAGAVGNAYDRLFSFVHIAGRAEDAVGQVRDFIDVYAVNYPIFNVADILLVLGVGIILISLGGMRSKPVKK